MKYTIMAMCLLTGSITFGECIKELEISGFELLQKSYKFKTAHIETSDNKFVKLTDLNINSIQLYKVQIPEHKFLGDFSRYNRKYIEYYRYSRMGKFLAENNNKFQNLGYETTIVGKSIENDKAGVLVTYLGLFFLFFVIPLSGFLIIDPSATLRQSTNETTNK